MEQILHIEKELFVYRFIQSEPGPQDFFHFRSHPGGDDHGRGVSRHNSKENEDERGYDEEGDDDLNDSPQDKAL